MKAKPEIRAGLVEEIDPSIGDWVYVDPGFSSIRRSCGLLLGNGQPSLHTFGELSSALVALARLPGPVMNLVIEAPLSVAFGPGGNPIGRTPERRGNQVRYWYTGLGCAVMVSATHLMRAITDAASAREIRLYEGMVTFKERGKASDHCSDVQRLAAVVNGLPGPGRVVSPSELLEPSAGTLFSAFKVAGMDYGIPAIIEG